MFSKSSFSISVARRVRAWIETKQNQRRLKMKQVARRVRAWIETKNKFAHPFFFPSHAACVRGLRFSPPARMLEVLWLHAACVRGLKRYHKKDLTNF
ncbi:MAG: hypothetical protein ACPL2D_04630, partial [Ignavibacteria bacterium]